MARLYANENFSLPVVEELRRLGHDVLTTLDAGNAGKAVPDEAVLIAAVVEREGDGYGALRPEPDIASQVTVEATRNNLREAFKPFF